MVVKHHAADSCFVPGSCCVVERVCARSSNGARRCGSRQMLRTRDGTLLVARFGRAEGGGAGIAWVRADGSHGLVPGIPESRKRLGLAEAPDGSIYSSYF